MENVNKSMTQDEDIQELLQMLRIFKHRKEAGEVYELTAYIDSMENKLDQVMCELNTVRKQLEEVKELNEKKSLKEVLTVAVENLEDSCKYMKEQLFKIKQEVGEKAKEVVQSVKDKGISGLNKLSEFFGVGKMLKNMKEKLEQDLAQVNSVMSKIDAAGLEIKKAATSIGNVGRALAGKELKEVKEKKVFSMSDIIKAPWIISEKFYGGMLKLVEGAIEKTENLSKRAEQIKLDNQKDSKTYEEQGESFNHSIVAEERGYNSEAFEAFQQSIDKKRMEPKQIPITPEMGRCK